MKVDTSAKIKGTFYLKEGATTRATWSHILHENWTTYTRELSASEANAITDYSQLRLTVNVASW